MPLALSQYLGGLKVGGQGSLQRLREADRFDRHRLGRYYDFPARDRFDEEARTPARNVGGNTSADVNDVGATLEQIASLRLGDEARTKAIRRRYLAIALDGLRTPEPSDLSAPPPTWPAAPVAAGNGARAGTFLVDGFLRRTWRFADGRVRVEPFAPLARREAAALDDEAEGLRAFLTA